LVAVEAMSAGLVPVLHPNDAYRVLSTQHPGLCLADFARPEECAVRIEQAFQALLANPAATRDDMMAGAAVHAWESVADRYIDVYRAALGNRVPPQPRSLPA
ncbi:MAG: glycosyltransferase family 1 protein, partial [Rhizobium sp.]|nr:glycosyltransferase family 1 protein [Rhizobium sp.]